MNDPQLTAKAVEALNADLIVERRYDNALPWVPCNNGHLAYLISVEQLDSDHVRIAEPPKFVPWEFADIPTGGAITRKEDGAELLIIAKFPDKEHGAAVLAGEEWFRPDELADDFTLKGQPCGKAAQS